MNHHVVRGEDLVDARQRNRLGMAGGAGSKEAGRLVVDIVDYVRFCFTRAFHEGGVAAVFAAHDDDDVGPVISQCQGLRHGFAAGIAHHEHLRTGVVDAPGQFARAEAEAHRAADGAGLVGGDIAESELGTVPKHHHQDVAFLQARIHQRIGEAVAFDVQFPVGPTPII